uniref:Peptidase S9 prolyl oligopeptidase catalytic domain-containing protein n=1 Tax=Mastacembelus armatus TaxID=205130 RepID=A0A7N8Y2Q2_9TELE
MLLSSARWLILLHLLYHVDAGRILWKIKERVRDLQLQKAKQHLLIQVVGGHQPLKLVNEGQIHQPLDHFNRRDVRTFPQRFFVNEAYWQRPHGPVFLFIGGEGPIFEFDVLAGHHVDMAEKHGALLLALEHRFYGNSINPDEESVGHEQTDNVSRELWKGNISFPVMKVALFHSLDKKRCTEPPSVS